MIRALPRCRATAVLSAAAAALPLLAGCSAGPVQVAPPSPRGAAAEWCRELGEVLPERLDGAERRRVEPASAYTAAWGDPAVVLRCGIALPEVLTPGSEGYDPATATVEANGVQWLPEQQGDDGYVFTTVGRRAHVSLRVPGAYHPGETDFLVDLARAVRETVPTRL